MSHNSMEQKPGKETSKKDVGQTDMEYVEGGEIRCCNLLIQFFYPGYEYIKINIILCTNRHHTLNTSKLDIVTFLSRQ